MSSKNVEKLSTKYKELKTESVAQFGHHFKDEEAQAKEQQAPSLDEPCACFPTMTYKQRLIGFGFCLAMGGILYVLSIIFLTVRTDIVRFAIVYTIGNIIALLSTLFLVGPLSQLKRMVKPHRAIAFGVYVLTLVGTLICAFVMDEGRAQKGVIIVLMILQTLALLWYTLSFIPFARKFARSLFKSYCPCCPKDAVAD